MFEECNFGIKLFREREREKDQGQFSNFSQNLWLKMSV